MLQTIVPDYFLQVKIYKDDFEEERKDREEAHSKLADLEMKEKELKDRIARQQEVREKNKINKSHEHVCNIIQ